jgi:serine/threonine protein kinase
MVIQIIRDAVAGLAHLHELGYIHMDIKLENLVTVGDVTKLIDFDDMYDTTNPVDRIACTIQYLPPGLTFDSKINNCRSFSVRKTNSDIWM